MKSARSLALVDQVLSNASNSLLVVLVAGATAPATFGRFALGYAILAFAVGIWRNGLSYRVSLRADDQSVVRDECRRAAAVSVLGSPLVALPVLLATLPGTDADPLLAWGLALATPFVLTQDLLRYASVAAGDAWAALSSDLVWAMFLVVAVAGRFFGAGAGLVISMWFLGSVSATTLILWRLKILPRFDGTATWIAGSLSDRAHLTAGGVVAGASVPVMSALVASIAGSEVFGGIAGAGLLMAPTNSLVAYVSLTQLAHAAAMPAEERRWSSARIAAITALVTLIWGLLLMLVPPSLGTTLLGDTWFFARQAVPLVGLQYALGVLATVATLLLISENQSVAVHLTSWVQAAGRVLLAVVSSALVATVLSVTVGQTAAMAVWLMAALIAVKRRS